jgi:hypothetical protein
MVRFNARVSSEIAVAMRILVASHVEVLLTNFTCATNNQYRFFAFSQATVNNFHLGDAPNNAATALLREDCTDSHQGQGGNGH